MNDVGIFRIPFYLLSVLLFEVMLCSKSNNRNHNCTINGDLYAPMVGNCTNKINDNHLQGTFQNMTLSSR